MCSAHCWSKPRRGMERIMTVASYPSPVRNPAHSRATYDAPTTSVLPGGFCREKRSSDVMQHSLSLGSPRYLGRPPVATMILSAVAVLLLPFLSVSSTVWASTKRASELRYLTLFSRSSVLYRKLREQMWSWMWFTIVSQSCVLVPSPAYFHPKLLASSAYSPTRVAWCISFLGMHPTLTHVPPRPQVVPWGVGVTKSQTATRAPRDAASLEQARPPEPPPMIRRS
mmetsp:Transcript_41319/g.103307  ORF Transcript_41319/g.103307 Transcript_41319/m.103307 type:complete len:226 (-) Transcript_41319:203-880(-)